jgi:RES domain-containing protein
VARSYRGKLYRALNPIYAGEPLSGEGARRYGGRFNPRGTPALYASLSIMTALREANQIGSLQPTTLVAYDAEIDTVFDATDAAALRDEGMDAAALAASTWRDEMKAKGVSRSQSFARALIAKGYAAGPQLRARRHRRRSQSGALAVGQDRARAAHFDRR